MLVLYGGPFGRAWGVLIQVVLEMNYSITKMPPVRDSTSNRECSFLPYLKPWPFHPSL